MATKEKREVEHKEIPDLTDSEKLELQNIMLHMALESERVEKYEMQAMLSRREIKHYESKINDWKNQFENKLKENGFNDITINMLDINAETGKVKLLSNVHKMTNAVTEK